jgi:hypothetical protein
MEWLLQESDYENTTGRSLAYAYAGVEFRWWLPRHFIPRRPLRSDLTHRGQSSVSPRKMIRFSARVKGLRALLQNVYPAQRFIPKSLISSASSALWRLARSDQLLEISLFGHSSGSLSSDGVRVDPLAIASNLEGGHPCRRTRRRVQFVLLVLLRF